MKKLPLALSLLAISAFTYAADNEEAKPFSEVDTNKDGVLNISEAKMAMPDLNIEDANDDGIVDISEVEAALPDLKLDVTDTKAPVRQAQYDLISKAMMDKGSEGRSTASTSRSQTQQQPGADDNQQRQAAPRGN